MVKKSNAIDVDMLVHPFFFVLPLASKTNLVKNNTAFLMKQWKDRIERIAKSGRKLLFVKGEGNVGPARELQQELFEFAKQKMSEKNLLPFDGQIDMKTIKKDLEKKGIPKSRQADIRLHAYGEEGHACVFAEANSLAKTLKLKIDPMVLPGLSLTPKKFTEKKSGHVRFGPSLGRYRTDLKSTFHSRYSKHRKR